mmetsp:Transcript_53729/g.123163  ORF Transcript_53729/g.123163 Transcript_53729/m.123163 type:complete len:208 (+) Transcript_53729:204-827(+)
MQLAAIGFRLLPQFLSCVFDSQLCLVRLPRNLESIGYGACSSPRVQLARRQCLLFRRLSVQDLPIVNLETAPLPSGTEVHAIDQMLWIQAGYSVPDGRFYVFSAVALRNTGRDELITLVAKEVWQLEAIFALLSELFVALILLGHDLLQIVHSICQHLFGGDVSLQEVVVHLTVPQTRRYASRGISSSVHIASSWYERPRNSLKGTN